MKLGLTLSGNRLNRDHARFAAQLGATAIVVHLTQYDRDADPTAYLAGGVGPLLGNCAGETLWTFEQMSGVKAMLAEFGLELAALENFSPNFWYDVLLDGPRRGDQIEALKRLIRDAGRAGIACIGYNFSIAGVWGWRRLPLARGGATTAAFDMHGMDSDAPIPDGMVWNMRFRPARPGAAPVTLGEVELWDRFARFLTEIMPVAQEAGVRLAAHPDDPPAQKLRGTARLVNHPAKYQRLLSLVDSPSNALEFCIGSLAEMPGADIYTTTRYYARTGRIAYVHFRNVRGQVPSYHEAFVDDGDVDMAEIVRILRDEHFEGVLVPDHVPELHCSQPWHAGNAHAIGYMRALLQNAEALGPARTPKAPILADLASTPDAQGSAA